MKRVVILLLLCAPAAGADELGRLFTTAQERAALERGPTPPPPPPVRFQGVVSRRGGTMVWIDDRPLAVGESHQGVRVVSVSGSAAALLLPGRRDPVTLLAGEAALRERDVP